MHARSQFTLMIFLTEKVRNRDKVEVFVYVNLEDLAQRVEWQDILDESIRILDEDGNIYVWDDAKRSEVGTVYHYSFKRHGVDLELIKKCKDKFIQLGKPDNFDIENN